MSGIDVRVRAPRIKGVITGHRIQLRVTTGMGGGSGPAIDHRSLTHRDDPEQHEIGAITGLREELDELAADTGGGAGTVTTVADVSPDVGGNVPLTAHDLDSLTATEIGDADAAVAAAAASDATTKANAAFGAAVSAASADATTKANAAEANANAHTDALFASNDFYVYKGQLNCSTNPNYPAADAGWNYRVSVAGRIGGNAGPPVEIGDLLVCIVDNSVSGDAATVGANWEIVQGNIDGQVIGPAAGVTDGDVVVFDGISGRSIKSGGHLGSAAFAATTDFATAAQGATADTAVQPARTISAGTGLLGGGDLSADRSLAPDFGTGAGKVVQGNDPALTNPRTPTAHAATHKSGGTDPIRLDELAAPTADVSLNTHRLTSVVDPTNPQDADTKAARDAADLVAKNAAIAAAAVDATNKANDAVAAAAIYTNAQVADKVSTAFDWKASVVVASTANVTLIGTQTVNGVAVISGNRVLLKAQTNGAENGIWIVSTGAWTRATDADTSAKVTGGMSVPVVSGTVDAGRQWMLTTPDPITLNTTALTFSKINTGDLVAANNLSDLTNAATARTNLGLGTAATQAATAFAAATHAAQHKSGGADPIRTDELAVPTSAVQWNAQALLNLASPPGTPLAAANESYADQAGTDAVALGRLRQAFSNANVSVNNATRRLSQTGTMSASRAAVLPAAVNVPAGDAITIIDESGTVGSSNTLVVTRAGSDTIDGATTYTMNAANMVKTFYSDGVSKWTADPIVVGGGGGTFGYDQMLEAQVFS